MEKPETYRYQQVADFVADMVSQGVLRAGMRAPSLRAIARQQCISVTTAQLAYQQLEDRGILEARPKSGFFVTRHNAISLPSPAKTNPPMEAQKVTLGRSVRRLLDHASDRNMAPLGCAIPDRELLAAGQLDRFLARVARTKGTQFNVYVETRGLPELRHEISQRALRIGQILAPENMLITCGCTEALSLALQVLVEPGDTIAIESPTYFGLLHILERLDIRALELPTDPEGGPDPKALDDALSSGNIQACLFSSSFSNPLGCLVDEEKKRQLLKILAKHSIPLIEDDIYGDIHFTQERPKPYMALTSEVDIIYCSSYSKTVAPGYRIGWLSSSRHMEKILDAKFSTTLSGPALPQLALAAYLSSGGYDAHLRRIRRIFMENIDRMSRAVERWFPEETRITRPQGGFVLWLELAEGVDVLALYESALEKGICFAPGKAFTASNRYSNCLRLSCAHRWSKDIEQAVKQLGEMACTLKPD